MKPDLWLGIDLGTQGVRTVIVDSQGRHKGNGRSDFTVRESANGFGTHDPQGDWTAGTIAAIRAAIATVDPRRVSGIGVCGVFPASVLLDPSGQPLGAAILHGDARAQELVQEVEGRLGVSLTGDEVSPRLLWMSKARSPELARAAHIVGPTGFVVHLLTGRAVIDPHSAYRWGGMVDGSRMNWTPDLPGALGISAGLLPEIAPPHSIAGAVTPGAAAATGLAAGTPVVVGTTDSLATFIGHCANRLGDAVIYYGSSWTLMALTVDLEVVVRDAGLIGDGAPWRLLAYAIDSGRFIECLRVAMLGARANEDLDSMAVDIPLGARGVVVIPEPSGHFDGQRLRPGAGAVVGIGLDHGSADIWRAALESLGHLIAVGLERLDDPIRRVYAAGGGAQSAIWRQITSDVTGLEQRQHPGGSAALGAALLAAYGLGAVPGIDAAAAGWLPDDEATFTRPRVGRTQIDGRDTRAWQTLEQAIVASALALSQVQRSALDGQHSLERGVDGLNGRPSRAYR